MEVNYRLVSHRLFFVSEVMEHVLGFASALTIIAFGKTSQRGREYMEATLATLIREMLLPYFANPG